MPEQKEVILVRGKDIASQYPWRYAHPRTARSATRLVLFDCQTLRKKVWNDWSGTYPPPGAPAAVSVIGRGILDIYDHVKALGRTAPGSLVELHFFTHGWTGGPVLRNTYEVTVGPTQNARDPDDVDPRLKDFRIASVVGGANGQLFRRAFARTALVKLWGCNSEGAYQGLVAGYYKAARLRESRKRLALQRRFKASFQDRLKRESYALAMSRLIGLDVYAAPAGWGSNVLPVGYSGQAAFDRKTSGQAKYVGRWVPSRGELWWTAGAWFEPLKGLRFYRDVLRARLDPVNFVAYNDALVVAAADPLDEADEEAALATFDYPAAYGSAYPSGYDGDYPDRTKYPGLV